MNEWKFYQAVIAECKKRYDNWDSMAITDQEMQFNQVYDELCSDDDIITSCLD